MIYSNRIKQARELCGMTQAELASRIGINQSAISQIENGEFIPSPHLLKAITNETGFLISFFENEPLDDFPIGSLVFRAKRTLKVHEETNAYQYAKIIFEQVKKMALQVEVPPSKLPKLVEGSPNVAAQLTRSSFGLSPEAPVKNLVQTVERNGVLVFSLPFVLPNIDAFSTWAELDSERPIIAISAGKPMDRLRFSIAHELGHLVMHQPVKGNIKAIESEAHDFASEFLLPEVAMRHELSTPLTLTNLARLKGRWGVSMQAIIYRARSLKVISDRQAKYLFTQMSAHGWRKREPSNLDIKLETPRLVRRMIETLYNAPEEYALDMGLTAERATEFYVYA